MAIFTLHPPESMSQLYPNDYKKAPQGTWNFPERRNQPNQVRENRRCSSLFVWDQARLVEQRPNRPSLPRTKAWQAELLKLLQRAS
jgi:hypothetical protein